MENNSNDKTLLIKAIIAVMSEVKGIDKTMTVGSGAMSYKGVPDKEVKKIIGEAMSRNKLCIIPTDTEAKTQIDRWEEVYNGVAKQKQSVFTEVKTKYLLMHESGQYIELSGYGHGVDSQDKSAGKATTYALKYTLLYTFLIPTGKIDDADTTHSDTHQVPQQQIPQGKPKCNDTTFAKAIDKIKAGDKSGIQKMIDAFDLSTEQLNVLQDYK